MVIALCVNRSKNPREISSNKSHLIKKYYANDLNKDLDYIRIIEIYLSDYYNKIDEKIQYLKVKKLKIEEKNGSSFLLLNYGLKK